MDSFFYFNVLICISFFLCNVSYATHNEKMDRKTKEKSERLNKKLFEKVDQKYVLKKTVVSLLEKKANPNAFSQGGVSSFHRLVQRAIKKEKRVPLVNLFLIYKADPNLKDKNNQGPLDYIVEGWNSGTESLLKTLFMHNADPNIKGDCDNVPLHFILGGNFTTHSNCPQWQKKAKIFLEAKADIALKNKAGKPPLDYFFEYSYEENPTMLPLLLEHGGRNYCTNRFGPTAVADPYLLKLAIEYGIDSYTARSKDFDRMILYVAENRNLSVNTIQLFLECGLNPCKKIVNNQFGYNRLNSEEHREKRNILAYAIPRFIRQKNQKQIQSLYTFLVCLHITHKITKRRIPRGVRLLIKEQIFGFALEDTIIKYIKNIETKNRWEKTDSLPLDSKMEEFIKYFG